MAGLLNNGMRMENFGGGVPLLMKKRISAEAKWQKQSWDRHHRLQLGKPLFTDGEIDPEKTVDITNLKADEKDQSKHNL